MTWSGRRNLADRNGRGNLNLAGMRTVMLLTVLAACASLAQGIHKPKVGTAGRCSTAPTTSRLHACTSAHPAPCFDRRQLTRLAQAGALGLALPPVPSFASSNPGKSYYMPVARYRYLPRIDRAFHALKDDASLQALDAENWGAMATIYDNADDATTALALYANMVEGSRSSKSKKKTDRQKQLYGFQATYKQEMGRLGAAIKSQSKGAASEAMRSALVALTSYQELAEITGENGVLRHRRKRAGRSPAQRCSPPCPPTCFACPALPPDIPRDQIGLLAVAKGGGGKAFSRRELPVVTGKGAE